VRQLHFLPRDMVVRDDHQPPKNICCKIQDIAWVASFNYPWELLYLRRLRKFSVKCAPPSIVARISAELSLQQHPYRYSFLAWQQEDFLCRHSIMPGITSRAETIIYLSPQNVERQNGGATGLVYGIAFTPMPNP